MDSLENLWGELPATAVLGLAHDARERHSVPVQGH